MKGFYQLFSLAITSLAITYFKTPCKRNNESQSKAGDGELHSRGRMHGPGDNGWGGVLARAGSCLWLMEGRDCGGISLVHLNISVYYKCSPKIKCRRSVCSPVVRHGKLWVWVL